MVPQGFDKRYFTVHLMGPYSEKFDYHLAVWLKLPNRVREVPDGFREEFIKLVNDFENYIGPEP